MTITYKYKRDHHIVTINNIASASHFGNVLDIILTNGNAKYLIIDELEFMRIMFD